MGRSRHLKNRLRLSLLALVVGALAVNGISPARQVREQRDLIAAEKQKLAKLTAENAELQSRLDRTADPAYMELLARKQLGLVRPGESAYLMVPGRQIPAPSTRQASESSFWSRLAGWFTDTFNL